MGIKKLFTGASFYIGGFIGLFLFFISLGLGLNGPDEAWVRAGMLFAEMTTFPVKLLIGPFSQTLANLLSIVYVFVFWGLILSVIVRLIRKKLGRQRQSV